MRRITHKNVNIDMKRIVRHSIFETNSSSTHSLSIKKTDDAKCDRRASFVITDALEKIVWFFCVIAECEDNYKGKIAYYGQGKTIDEVKKELIDIIRNLYDKNKDSYNWCFGNEKPDFDNWDEEEICQFFEVVCEEKVDVYESLCILESVNERNAVLAIKDLLIKAYCEAENISEDEALDRIDKNYNSYDELLIAIEDPNKHARARRILRRVSMRIETDYQQAEDKRAVLEKYKKEFEESELDKDFCRYSCTRFFCESSLEYCDCGFGTYWEILDNFADFADEEGVKKFLSSDVAVVGYER